MICERHFKGSSLIHRTDPALRIVASAAIAALLAVASEPQAAAAGLIFAVGLVLTAGLSPLALLKRLIALNLLMAILAAVLGLTMGGEAAVFGPIALSRPGLERAGLIALRANAIVLTLTALVGTMEAATMAHALERLRCPRRLTHLFYFTVRYIDVLHHEYRRVRTAMRARCFRPGMDAHTYRTFGHLTGMLLVRSLDRSERVLSAMKCRGFRDKFRVFRRTEKPGGNEAFLAIFCLLMISVISGIEWIWSSRL